MAAKPAAVRNSKKLELPVLAKDGDNVLLRFTKIFSPAAEEMERPHPAKIRQPVTGTIFYSANWSQDLIANSFAVHCQDMTG